MARRREMVAMGGLPYDAQVEWLASNGYNYFDTGFLADNTAGFSVNVACLSGYKSDSMFIGVRNDGGNTRFSFGFSNPVEFYGWGDVQSVSGRIKPTFGTFYDATLNWLNERMARFGSNTFTEFFSSYTLPSFTRSAYLFAANWNGTLIGQLVKITRARFSRGSTIEHDFIPVKKGGVGYMYDRITKKMLQPLGTGAFEIGPEVSAANGGGGV